MSQPATPPIDLLLRLVPDSSTHTSILAHLRNQPALASTGDAHGYTLLHAAASYSHPELIITLVQEYKVDINIKDEDGDTPLFYVEDLDTARCLIGLGADVRILNSDGEGVVERIEESVEGDEVHALVQYLKDLTSATEQSDTNGPAASGATLVTGNGAEAIASSSMPVNGDGDMRHPPPLPEGVKINIGTMMEDEAEPPDPEFRRKIEELAAREDFQSEDGQKELRRLVEEAVRGVANEQGQQDGRDTQRRRME
jgi:uncharacterized protein